MMKQSMYKAISEKQAYQSMFSFSCLGLGLYSEGNWADLHDTIAPVNTGREPEYGRLLNTT